MKVLLNFINSLRMKKVDRNMSCYGQIVCKNILTLVHLLFYFTNCLKYTVTNDSNSNANS